MRKLEQEVKEFQAKFLNAIKLSKAIAEKYDKAINRKNQDGENEDNPHNGTLDLDMKAVIDQIRTYLVGGKGTWNSMKDKWMDYVHLDVDKELIGNSKHLHKLQKKTKTRQRKKKVLEASKIGSQFSIGNSLVKVIKIEKDMHSPTEIENDSLGPESRQEEIERSSVPEEESDSPFDDNNDDTVDNEDSMKFEFDSVEDGQLQLNEEKLNVHPNETSVDRKEASDELGPHAQNRTTTTDSLVKHKKVYHDHVGRRRAQHPNLSTKELRTNLPGRPGRTRRPIEELKSTSNTHYIKWRQSPHGMTMSVPAYQKMRRELALQRQKILDEGGPFMPAPEGGVLPVKWVEKDGKLTYLGFEVNKREDSTMSCSLCPSFSTKYRLTMSHHIKKNHIEGTKNNACDQCDAKFVRPSELKNHVQRKHACEGANRIFLPTGRRRCPIEELKTTTGPNKHYVKWRQSHHGMTMSQPAYKKMRRELALQRQKILDEGGLFMSKLNDTIVPVRWVEKDGKLSYLGVEVKKHEDGTMTCSLCPDWNFPPCKQRNSLTYHIKKYHIEVDKKFACEQCDAKFTRSHDLIDHVQAKHAGGYQCEICGTTLSDRSGLFHHVRIKHNGIKPHICEHCGKGFGTKKDMTIHVRRHTGERPFVCHVCADTFIEKQSMKKHIRKKHPGEPTDEIKNKPQYLLVSKSTAAEKTTAQASEESLQK